VLSLVLAVAAVSVQAAVREHPRLFVRGQQDFAAFNARAAADPLWGSMREFMLAEANRALEVPNVVPKMDGKRLLASCDNVGYRLTTLATAARLTDDVRYVKRLKEELFAACAWPSWNPNHYLDTALLQMGVAVAYDWLYDAFTPDERKTVRKAIVAKAWDEAKKTRLWWKRTSNNWQATCWCGVVMAALAIWEDEPERAKGYIDEAVGSMPVSMGVLAPNGAYPEGPGYWHGGVLDAVLLVEAIESATGESCPLAKIPGFLETGAYPTYVYDPTGASYSYCDCAPAKRGLQGALLWLARRSGRYEWARPALGVMAERGWESRKGALTSRTVGRFPFLLALWAQGLPTDAAKRPCTLPLDWSGGGYNPIVTMRSGWDDPSAAFLAVKGGLADMSHGHMDAGSFLFVSDGVRWCEDIGSQDYLSIESLGMDLWNTRQTGDRWKVFRLSEKAHNLVLIDGRPPCVTGRGKVVETNFGERVSYAVIDLAEVFAGQATAARRVATLDKIARSARVVDDFTGVRAGARVAWNMLTRVRDVKVDAEGNRIILSHSGKNLEVVCTRPHGVSWKVEECAKPMNSWDCANPGLRRISFSVVAPKDGKVSTEVRLQSVGH